jgi:hypothetical protein
MSNLKALCTECVDPNARVVSNITVGQQFHLQRAVLASKASKVVSRKGEAASRPQQAAAIADKLTKGKADGGFVVENKFDGWRLASHIADIDDIDSLQCAAGSVATALQFWFSRCCYMYN